jgi:invasion protein IalB
MPFSFPAVRSRHVHAAFVGSCLLMSATAAFAQAQRPAQPPAQQAAPQGQAPQGPMKVDLNPTQSDWTKVCGHDNAANRDVCYTTRDFGTQTDQPPVLALAVYDIKGDDTKIVRFLMPVGLMLRPGFRFSVDKGAAQDGTFEICFPNGCFAEVKVKTPTVDAMKKGQTVTVAVKNQVNNEVTFNIPIAGFGKAFDGAAIDPKVLEEQQKKLQDEMQKKADDMRKSEAQKTGTPVPPATSPAPAPGK